MGRVEEFKFPEGKIHYREPFFLAKQSPVYQAGLTAWGLLRRKERSSQ
jgi:hypothetical protein